MFRQDSLHDSDAFDISALAKDIASPFSLDCESMRMKRPAAATEDDREKSDVHKARRLSIEVAREHRRAGRESEVEYRSAWKQFLDDARALPAASLRKYHAV